MNDTVFIDGVRQSRIGYTQIIEAVKAGKLVSIRDGNSGTLIQITRRTVERCELMLAEIVRRQPGEPIAPV